MDNKTQRSVYSFNGKQSKVEDTIRILLDESTDPIFSFERDGTYRYINWAFARPFDKSPADIIGKKIWDIFPKDEADQRFSLVKHVFETGEIGTIEVRVPQAAPKKDLFYLTSAKPVFDPSGQVEMVICISKDISERKRVEDALRSSEEKLRHLTDHAPIAIAWANQDGVLEYINQAFTNIFGYELNEIPTLEEWFKKAYSNGQIMGPNEHLSPDSIQTSGDNQNGPIIKQLSVNCKNGLVRIVQVARAVINGYYYAMFMDVTDRIKAEEEIRCMNEELEARVLARTAALEQANRELESFSYSISHDLRTPLRAIDGFSSILMDDFSGSLPLEGQQICQSIRNNTHRMSQLIDDLLNFSRLSRYEMRQAKVDNHILAQSAFDELTDSEVRSRINFCLMPLPITIGDPDLMYLVWLNLLSNAIKFSSRRNKANIEIGCQMGDMESIFHIRDNGAGFDMQYVGKLFKVFQRLHAIHDFEGTGVGLAIVQRVIQKHQGRVWAESKPNEGATFYFALPQQDASI